MFQIEPIRKDEIIKKLLETQMPILKIEKPSVEEK